MTTQSFTGEINTNGEFVDVETAANVTLTSDNKYNFQVINNPDYPVEFKVEDAIFRFNNEKFEYTAGSDTLYIRTNTQGCTLTILGD